MPNIHFVADTEIFSGCYWMTFEIDKRDTILIFSSRIPFEPFKLKN